MKIAGVIAEYNPFHNGHKYHLEETRRGTGAEAVVAVMSGDFVQRGGPALYDKWIRAEAAVRNGVDLVLELPFPFACGSAEVFAAGGVGILDSLGIVDVLSFGVEEERTEHLRRVAELFAEEPLALKMEIRAGLDRGLSFPKARAEGIMAFLRKSGEMEERREEWLAIERLLEKPNGILAIEYFKQLIWRNSRMEAFGVKREGADYHDSHLSGGVASATAIRLGLKRGQNFREMESVLPAETMETLLKYDGTVLPLFEEDFFSLIRYQLLCSSEYALGQAFSASEGIENRMKKAGLYANDYEDLLSRIKSKRYTRTRLQRLLTHVLLGLSKEEMQCFLNEPCLYVRPLAFNVRGKEILKELKREGVCKIPVIDQGSRQRKVSEGLSEGVRKLFDFERKAANLYSAVSGAGSAYERSDYRMKPYFLNTSSCQSL